MGPRPKYRHKKTGPIENRLVVAKGQGVGGGMESDVGLAGVSFCVENGEQWLYKSCCRAQRAMLNIP